jgi:hypothetical protein
LTTNQEQGDVDQNGIGDACDLLISEISIEPETPMQGRSMIVSVALTNNRPYAMQNMVLKSEVPKLGMAISEDLPAIPAGERIRRELVMRVPECAAIKPVDVAIIAEYPVALDQKEVFSHLLRLPIQESGQCSKDPQNDRTTVEILELQDVTGQGAVYPFTITNSQAESRAYVLNVDGLGDWGDATIYPGSVVVVAPGETSEGAVQLFVKDSTAKGKRSFTFTVQSRDESKQVTLTASIPERVVPSKPSWSFALGVAAFFVLIVVVALIFLLTQKNHK